MKVINLFAGPGAGKSTAAAGLFFKMKSKGYNVELVTEFAKDCVYEGDYETLRNQALLLKEQDHRLRRLMGQVDWAITDSPLLMQLAYLKPPFDTKRLRNKITTLFDSYNNKNFFIIRQKPYVNHGRDEKEDRVRQLDKDILKILVDHCGTDYFGIIGDESAPDKLLELI